LRFCRLVWCESVAVLDGLACRRREDVCESTDAHREERWHRVRGEDPSRLVFSVPPTRHKLEKKEALERKVSIWDSFFRNGDFLRGDKKNATTTKSNETCPALASAGQDTNKFKVGRAQEWENERIREDERVCACVCVLWHAFEFRVLQSLQLAALKRVRTAKDRRRSCMHTSAYQRRRWCLRRRPTPAMGEKFVAARH
jgi:hypothetical protein